MSTPTISTQFPYDSKYIKVHNANLHYVDLGQGDPILFVHGNPTSSYLWRNVIPHLTSLGRCIAVDLIGMGQSDKPDIGYGFFDHAKYLEGFIEQLGLKNVTLVLHDWGGGLGFHYAKRHESNIKAICFMEAVTKPLTWKDLGFIDRLVLKRFRHPKKGEKILVQRNEFIEKVLPRFVMRKLDKTEMDNYRAPYQQLEDRKVIWRWPNEIPIDGQPADVHQAIDGNYQWLLKTELPKLLLWCKPGAIIKAPYVEFLNDNLPNLTSKCVGKGRHYMQEDNPDQIGKDIASWYQTLTIGSIPAAIHSSKLQTGAGANA